MKKQVLYYLGVPVEPLEREGDWIWCLWPNGKKWKHWPGQLHKTPWGEHDKK